MNLQLVIKRSLLQHFWNGVMYFMHCGVQLYIKSCISFDRSYSLSFKPGTSAADVNDNAVSISLVRVLLDHLVTLFQ